MINKTTNYNLVKPTEDEFYDVKVTNSNMDTIDGELKKHDDSIVKLNESTENINEQLGDIENKKINYTDLTPITTSGTASAYIATIPTNMVEVTIVPHINNLVGATLNGTPILDREGKPIEKDTLVANIPTKIVRVGSNFFIASGASEKLGDGEIKSKIIESDWTANGEMYSIVKPTGEDFIFVIAHAIYKISSISGNVIKILAYSVTTDSIIVHDEYNKTITINTTVFDYNLDYVTKRVCYSKYSGTATSNMKLACLNEDTGVMYLADRNSSSVKLSAIDADGNTIYTGATVSLQYANYIRCITETKDWIVMSFEEAGYLYIFDKTNGNLIKQIDRPTTNSAFQIECTKNSNEFWVSPWIVNTTYFFKYDGANLVKSATFTDGTLKGIFVNSRNEAFTFYDIGGFSGITGLVKIDFDNSKFIYLPFLNTRISTIPVTKPLCITDGKLYMPSRTANKSCIYEITTNYFN